MDLLRHGWLLGRLTTIPLRKRSHSAQLHMHFETLLEELLLLGGALASKEPLFAAPSDIVKDNEA
jgi:hypothetical protein